MYRVVVIVQWKIASIFFVFPLVGPQPWRGGGGSGRGHEYWKCPFLQSRLVLLKAPSRPGTAKVEDSWWPLHDNTVIQQRLSFYCWEQDYFKIECGLIGTLLVPFALTCKNSTFEKMGNCLDCLSPQPEVENPDPVSINVCRCWSDSPMSQDLCILCESLLRLC